jgi:type I restriction enzyme S subunit
LKRWFEYLRPGLREHASSNTQDNLNAEKVRNLLAVLPPLAEQNAIAAFLDRETAKIDELIAEQQRLIELLAEKRQAVISHTVTKGLNPAAPMKDSGIEWLGEVPAGWAVTRLGNLFLEVDERGATDLPVLCVSIHNGISDRELDEDEMDRKVSRSEDRSIYKQVRPGDLVYNMMRAWQGAFGAARVEGMVSPAYVVARPRKEICTAFVEFMLRTPQAIEQMRRHSKGVTDFRLRLNWDEFKNIMVALPPKAEAYSICEDIGKIIQEHGDLAAEAQRAIVLLRERRTALISAAVTGRIDVRDFKQEAA